MVEEKMHYTWIDCDPGIDDALAIILMQFSPNINLLGLSVVSGNCSLESATTNAINVLNISGQINPTGKPFNSDVPLGLNDCFEYGGLKIPVIKGCAKPLIGENKFCHEIHGNSGLEAKFPKTPEHTLKYVNELSLKSTHFTTLMYEKFKSLNEKVTILAIGPLTNIALLLLNYPDVRNYIEKIVIMGGAMSKGNVTPVSEFNIYVDPLAAQIVLDSNLSIFMAPLDVTNTTILTDNQLLLIQNIQTSFSDTIHELLVYLRRSVYAAYGVETPLHDPCAAFFVANPNAFEYKLMRVDVETNQNSMCYGQTVCDFYGKFNQKAKNVHVCLKMNVDEFWINLIESFKRASIATN